MLNRDGGESQLRYLAEAVFLYKNIKREEEEEGGEEIDFYKAISKASVVPRPARRYSSVLENISVRV